MPNKVTLHPIYGLAHATLDQEPFDRSALPIRVMQRVTIEDVSPMLFTILRLALERRVFGKRANN
jgi:hypothetical protein